MYEVPVLYERSVVRPQSYMRLVMRYTDDALLSRLHRSIGNQRQSSSNGYSYSMHGKRLIDRRRGQESKPSQQTAVSPSAPCLARWLVASRWSSEHDMDQDSIMAGQMVQHCEESAHPLCQRSRQRHASYTSDGLVTVSWGRQWRLAATFQSKQSWY